MPPRIDVGRPPPVGRSADAADWLAYKGLDARVPTIRSSDAGVSCEFHYYLTRRLGLQPPYSYAEPLSLGTWMHRWFQYHGHEHQLALYEKALTDACLELRALSEAADWNPTVTEQRLATIRKDAAQARAWCECAFDVPVGRTTLRSFLSQDEVVGRELTLSYTHPDFKRAPLVVQLDRLVYDRKANVLWIDDYKSTGRSPTLRAECCPCEFQTWHYTFVTEWAIQSGDLPAQLGLPPNVRLGGLRHLIIRKPTIRMSASDRPIAEWKTVNHRDGTSSQKPIYVENSEPSYENYLERCRRWYMAEGEYAGAHIDDPPVNWHTTPRSFLDEEIEAEYHAGLRRLYSLATRRPYPVNFPRNGSAMIGHDGPTPWAPFYTAPVKAWPDIVQRQGMVRLWRDTPQQENDE